MEILSIKFVLSISMHKFLIQASNSTIEITFALFLNYPISCIFHVIHTFSVSVLEVFSCSKLLRMCRDISPCRVYSHDRYRSVGRFALRRVFTWRKKRKVFNTWLEAV